MSSSQTVRGSVPVSWESHYLLEIPAGPPPAGGFPMVLCLHGAREDGESLRRRLRGLEGAPYARLFPNGPFPVEVRDQESRRIGYAWYHYTGDQEAFETALDFGRDHLRRLLNVVAAAHPVNPDRVAILGFSQGGYLAGVAALRDRRRYRALVGIATRIKTEILTTELREARGFPVLLFHGEQDATVALEPQRRALEELRSSGIDALLEIHPGGHVLPRAAVPRIDDFLRRVLS